MPAFIWAGNIYTCIYCTYDEASFSLYTYDPNYCSFEEPTVPVTISLYTNSFFQWMECWADGGNFQIDNNDTGGNESKAVSANGNTQEFITLFDSYLHNHITAEALIIGFENLLAARELSIDEDAYPILAYVRDTFHGNNFGHTPSITFPDRTPQIRREIEEAFVELNGLLLTSKQ